MIDFTPAELELLRKAGAIPTPYNPNSGSQLSTDPTTSQYEQEQLRQASLGTTDSTLGILGNKISTGVGDTLPENLATLGKMVTPKALEKLAYPTLNNYIDKQQEESMYSQRELTPDAQKSTTAKVGGILGDVIGMGAPIIGASLINPTAGIAVATGLASASDASEFAQRRLPELLAKGMTKEQAQVVIDREQSGVFKESLKAEAPLNALSLGAGGMLARRAFGAVPGAIAGAGVDIPTNVVSGYLSEQNVGGALDSGVNKEIQNEKMTLGALIGGAIPGTLGAIEGRKNLNEVTDMSNVAQQSQQQRTVLSIALEPKAAQRRLEFLNSVNEDANIRYEVAPAVRPDGEIVPNKNIVVAIKENMPETKVEDTTVKQDDLTNQDGTVNTDTTNQKEVDNNDYPLSLQKTQELKTVLDQSGKVDDIKIYTAEKLNTSDLSDNNNMKSWLLDGDNARVTPDEVTSVFNKNIKDRSGKGVYEPNARMYKENDGTTTRRVEMFTAIRASDKEPFKVSVRDLKDNDTITLSLENAEAKNFKNNIAVYSNDNKIARISDEYAIEIAKLMKANAVDKLKAKIVFEKIPHSKKEKGDITRKIGTDGYVERAKLVLQFDLNSKADGLTYTKKIKDGDIVSKIEVPFFSKQEIDSANLSNQPNNSVAPKQEDVTQQSVAPEIMPVRPQDELTPNISQNIDKTTKQMPVSKEEKAVLREQVKAEKLNLKEQSKAEVIANKEVDKINQADSFRRENAEQIRQEKDIQAERKADEEQAKILEDEIVKDEATRIDNEFKQEQINNNINKVLTDKNADYESTVKAVKDLEDIVNDLNKAKSDNIKILFDSPFTTAKFTKQESQLIKLSKKENQDGPGLFLTLPDGSHFLYLNVENIKSLALRTDISLTDYTKFVYAHEVMGHGSLNTFFKSQEDLDKFLDNIYDNSKSDVVDFLIKKKSELYEFEPGDDMLSHRRAMVEEIVADLSAGRVSYEENGKIVVKDIEQFSRDYAVEINSDKNKESLLQELISFIKNTFNQIIGADVFKTYESAKADLNTIYKEISDINKSLQATSVENKLIKEFYSNATPVQMKFMRASASNPDYVHTAIAQLTMFQKGKELLSNLNIFNKLPWLGTAWGLRRTNKEFAKGFDIMQGVEVTANAIDNELNRYIKEIYRDKGLGWKTGLDKKDIPNVDKSLWETQFNKKPFTNEELVSKFGLNQKSIDAYNGIIKTHQRARDLKVMAKYYALAVKNGLGDKEYGKYQFALTELPYDKFMASVDADLKKYKGNIPDSMIEFSTVANIKRESYSFDIVPTGKYMVYAEKPDGTVVQFEQSNSKIDAQNLVKRIQANNKNSNVKVVMDRITNKIVELEDVDNVFNSKEKAYEEYVREQRKSNRSDITPFNYYNNLITSIDNVSRNASIHMHLGAFNSHVKNLKENGNNEMAVYLDKFRDDSLKPDSAIFSKLRNFNSVWNLGGSPASALANHIGFLTTVPQYLARFDGGLKEFYDAKGLVKEFSILFGKKTNDEIVEILANKYVKNGNKEQVKLDLKRLIDGGIISQIVDFDIQKSKDGRNLTSFGSNSANLVMRAYMAPFAKVEALNKLATAVASLNTAYKNNKDGYEFTRQAVFDTQGYYGKIGRPSYLRGNIGSMLYQFKTYPMNFVELNLHLLSTGGIKNKMSSLAMLGTLGVFGGAGALPFVQDGEEVIDSFGRIIGNDAIDSKKYTKDLLDDAGLGWTLNGIMYGLGLQNKVEMANIIPGLAVLDPANTNKGRSIKEIFGPTASNGSNLLDALTSLSKGRVKQSVYEGSPTYVRSLMSSYDATETGSFTDKAGRNVVEAQGNDIFWRGAGFVPPTLKKVQDTLQDMNKEKDRAMYVKGIVNNLYAQAIVKKDPELRVRAKTMEEETGYKSSPASIKKLVSNYNKGAVERTGDTLSKESKKLFS